MKKIISLAIISAVLCALIPVYASSGNKTQAAAELTKLYEKYDESDYNAENKQKLDEAYEKGLNEIKNSSDSDEAYKALNSAAENMISVDHRGRSVKLYISVEKTVLGQGFVIMPQGISARKYERASQVLVDFLDDYYSQEKNAYSVSGTIEHNFELTGIKEEYTDTGEDEEYRVPTYLRKYVGDYYKTPSDRFKLKKGDYTAESRFVLMVTNEFPNVSPSAVPVTEEDVLRWQFSVYGNGADLGADTYFSETPVRRIVDKDELIMTFADFHAKNDVDTLLKNEDNLKLYNKALTVLYNPAPAQTAIDRAVDKILEIKPSDASQTPAPPETPTPSDTPSELPTPSPNPSEKPTPSPAPTPTPTQADFKDVSKDHFAYEAINALTEKGILNGVEENLFAPESFVTRAEFSAMLMRASDADYSDTDTPFSDVSDSDWFASGVSYAYKNGITTGVSESEYKPFDSISRQDICVMLARCMKKSASSEYTPFADDENISDYAKNAVYLMKELGIVSGKSNSEFAPFDRATRAETAKILCGALNALNNN